MQPVLRTQGQKRRLGGSLLPSVKRSMNIADEMPMSSKAAGSLYQYRQSEHENRMSLGQSKEDDESRSRNYMQQV